MTDELRTRRYEPDDHDAVLTLHERALRDASGYVEDVPDELGTNHNTPRELNLKCR